jgi:outer membrane protein OmpA-like peptidoglycan-associated protein
MGSVVVVVKIEQIRKRERPMSRSAVTKSLAAAAIMGLFAAHAAAAQQTQSLNCPTHFVYFATGSHALTPEDQDHIRDVAAMMQSTPTFVATVVGKTDSVGSADFNEHLSQRRAEAVFEALVYANKVPENRVQLRWTGERLPFISAADEEAESHNRMAAIVVSDAASARCGA